MNAQQDTIIKSYLTFRLADEIFAAHAGKVLSIIELCKITPVPVSPKYMAGVINLRGTVLPVIDLRLMLGLPPAEKTVDSCIITLDVIVENKPMLIGAIVDAVQSVEEFEIEDILPYPEIGNKFRTDFIIGVVSIKNEFIIVLNMDTICNADNIADLYEKPKITG